MSQQELHIGTLVKQSDSIEDIRSKNPNLQWEGDNERVDGYLIENGEPKYISRGANLFKINKKEYEDIGFISEGSKDSNGSINFILSFYNGGTYFEEMLEELVDRLNNK